LIRSELPEPVELDESLSLPMPKPDSLPMPLSCSIGGGLGGSTGRATGRPPPSGLAALARELLDGREAVLEAGLEVAFRLDPPLRLLLPDAPVRLLLFPVVRLAVAFFLPPARDAVDRLAVLPRAVDFFAVDFFAVDFFAVDFLAVDRLAVDRLPVDFFADFFFAAIDPPFGCAMRYRADDVATDDRRITCDL
jgi:hypothetical protein